MDDNLTSLPPHAPEAERGVLGSLLLAAQMERTETWELVMGETLEKLGAGAPATSGVQFYINSHGVIYRAMLALDSENRKPDLALLINRLRDEAQLDQIGGVAYLSALMDASPSPHQIGPYLEVVVAKWRIRRSIQVALEHVDRAQHTPNVEETLSEFEGQVIALGDDHSQQGPQSLAETVPGAMAAIETSTEHRRQGLATGLQYPWSYANKMLMGLLPRQLTVIGGESSSGKTSLMLNIAEHLAVLGGHPVGILSAESGHQELTIRLLCVNARVNGKKVHSGYASAFDLGLLVRSAGRLTGAPIFIDDRSDLTPLQIRLRARRLVTRYGCKTIMLDHLHECSAPEARGDMKLEGKLLMAACRWVAQEFNIPVVVLGQLNREAQREMAKSPGRRPMKSDLRESGYIEQMADNICILQRDRTAGKKSKKDEGEEEESSEARELEEETWPMILEVVKQRNGPTGSIELTFHRPTFRFTDRYAGTGAVESGKKAVQTEEEAVRMAEAEELLCAMSEPANQVPQIPIEELIRCAEREVGKRKKFYPKWVGEGRMNPLMAEREIASMEAIVQTLKSVKQPLLL
jgi:replicative DNA helicase